MRRTNKSPIHSNKHYVHTTAASVAMAAIVNLTLAESVNVTVANAANEVVEGSLIKAIYVEYWLNSDDAANSSFILTVEKLPAAATPMTYAQSIALGTYPNKKNILYTTMGLVGPNPGQAVPVIRQFIAIPKGKQRMGLGDKIIVNLSGITNGIVYCGFATYKEYQ